MSTQVMGKISIDYVRLARRTMDDRTREEMALAISRDAGERAAAVLSSLGIENRFLVHAAYFALTNDDATAIRKRSKGGRAITMAHIADRIVRDLVALHAVREAA